jgi:hypothetical protein
MSETISLYLQLISKKSDLSRQRSNRCICDLSAVNQTFYANVRIVRVIDVHQMMTYMHTIHILCLRVIVVCVSNYEE